MTRVLRLFEEKAAPIVITLIIVIFNYCATYFFHISNLRHLKIIILYYFIIFLIGVYVEYYMNRIFQARISLIEIEGIFEESKKRMILKKSVIITANLVYWIVVLAVDNSIVLLFLMAVLGPLLMSLPNDKSIYYHHDYFVFKYKKFDYRRISSYKSEFAYKVAVVYDNGIEETISCGTSARYDYINNLMLNNKEKFMVSGTYDIT